MRALIRKFDALVCRMSGVFEFCEDDECLLRLRSARATHDLCFPGRCVRAGEPVLEIHVWNEHMPLIPPNGPDLVWAIRLQRGLVRSFQLVARHMQGEVHLASARAVGGVTVLFFPGDRSGGTRLMERLGFTITPYHRPCGAFGEFWENFYTWWIMWTYNPASLRHRRLLGLRRAEMWMPAEAFLARYGA